MHPRALTILLVVIGALATGCKFLGGGATTTAAATAIAPDTTKQARRTIQLELVFVRHDAHDDVLRAELWGLADEQFLPLDIRDRLAANGLRVGIVGEHLPPEIARRITPTAVTAAAGNELATDTPVTRRLLQLLPDRRGEIVTGSGIRELVLLERADDGVSGATYRDATTLLSMEVKPAANGSIEITVVPEVKHGPLEKSWVGEDGMFRLEAGQRQHRLDYLGFTATLPRDGMLVVACAGDDSASVGDCLLRDHERKAGACMRLVTIRPLADAVDPSFATDAGQTASEDETPLTVE